MTAQSCAPLAPWKEPRLSSHAMECHDCREPWPGEYMVSNGIWEAAFPDYGAVKRAAAKAHPQIRDARRKILLCLDCLAVRLGRALVREDFPALLRINRSVLVGIEVGEARGRELAAIELKEARAQRDAALRELRRRVGAP